MTRGGVEGRDGVNSVTFTLPGLPGSVNTIYEPGHSIYSSRPEWRIKAEWALWATKMKPYVLPFSIQENSLVRVDRCYYYPWFYKNGRWRKADVANMDKLLIDTIAKKIGVDDLFFKIGMTDTRNCDNGRVLVTLTEITEGEWRLWT